MEFSISILISYISILISIISLLISKKVYDFNKKTRKNDIKSIWDYSNSFGGYADKVNHLPSIHLLLRNSGNKVRVLRIVDLLGNSIYSSSINKIVNNNETLELIINSSKKTKHEEMCYEIDIYLENADLGIDILKIKGKGIYPKISPLKSFEE